MARRRLARNQCNQRHKAGKVGKKRQGGTDTAELCEPVSVSGAGALSCKATSLWQLLDGFEIHILVTVVSTARTKEQKVVQRIFTRLISSRGVRRFVPPIASKQDQIPTSLGWPFLFVDCDIFPCFVFVCLCVLQRERERKRVIAQKQQARLSSRPNVPVHPMKKKRLPKRQDVTC